jgi:hypothetical protein
MSIRVKQSDLAACVQQTLENIRTGLMAARMAGIDTMPEMEVTFSVDIVQNVQALTSTTMTSEDSSKSETVNPSNSSEVSNDGASTDVATQSGFDTTVSTTNDGSSEVNHRTANVVNVTNGADTVTQSNVWSNHT